MEPPRNTPIADPAFTSVPAPAGLLLCRDLIFTSKVKGTAEALGYRILVTSDQSAALSLIEEWQPRVVFIDLTAGEAAAPDALMNYQNLAGRDTWFIAFGPHVDTDILNAARDAGCQVVMPRSKFSAELPEVLRQYFNRPVLHGHGRSDPAGS
jgi:CheY-like chemotaxis protein